MIHRILTCRNHPELRWSCKDIAWTEREDGTGTYNGSRSIFFGGKPTGEGMYADGSGLHTSQVEADAAEPNKFVGVRECDCPSSDLILAPEDALVRRSK